MIIEQNKAPGPVTVVKMGGSVLTGLDAYQRCAAWLNERATRSPDTRWVVVVSAEFGMTDRLRAMAKGLCKRPQQRALNLLWSTAELRSVATLTLCLHACGVDAAGLNVHECGLRVIPGGDDGQRLQLDQGRLSCALRRHTVVVVPGFLAEGPNRCIHTLGRGGSDLTAVVLASGLGAARCELIKDVPGYFTKDPHRYADARPLRRISYAQAERMAKEGCDLLQARAIEAAADLSIALVVRSLEKNGARTVLSDEVQTSPIRCGSGRADRQSTQTQHQGVLP